MTAARRNSTLFKSMPYLRSAQARSIGFYIASWYTASLVTLFMNKWFMLREGMNGSPQTLAMAQMIFSALTGAINYLGARRGEDKTQTNASRVEVTWPEFVKQMALVGTMRFATVMLGLVALEHLAVSFTETIKSSAPFFTVIFARCAASCSPPMRKTLR